MTKQIYRFSGKVFDYKGDAKSKAAKALLGGKGAGLVMMAQQGLNVPPGFTITTDNCKTYMALSPGLRETFIASLMKEVDGHMSWLETQFGYMPLVSVRSGAPVSMPGMMDTILNVGLTQDNFSAWTDRIGGRPAVDSTRRLIQMLGSTGYGVDMGVFDFQLASVKKEFNVKLDTELTIPALQVVATRYLTAFEKAKGFAFPMNDAKEQLRVAIKAVFESWMNPRAIEYRKINKLDEGMGTAVNVQAMVFGNMGDTSGSGVLFTRNPSTGERKIMAEYLPNAQGEDVVAGIRTPFELDLHSLTMHSKDGDVGLPSWGAELAQICGKFEVMYNDMVDAEYTVQDGQLFILQSRTGKRAAIAAFKIATDMVKEGAIEVSTALSRLSVDQFKAVRRPMINPKWKSPAHLTGLPACPGVVSGKPVFSAKDAVICTEPCILVTVETDPDDIAGMAKAVGVLTQTGGATSHAAVVARAMDKPCVVGATGMNIDAVKEQVKKVTIDGATGRVWFNCEVPVIDSSAHPAVRLVMDWCLAKLGVVEASPVGLAGKSHLVFAAHWWGSVEIAEAVLSNLDPDFSTVDARSPLQLSPACDLGLISCFGVTPQLQSFKKVVVAMAHAEAPTVSVVDHDQLGLALAVPAEYATYRVLSQ